ncbi:hypothetical protein AA3266_0223 [Gluconobacter kondonii NBRC 3266]|nr:hypothetical protein AA3266_0223 [Gluconobacter kondonii NBRC 3266]
MRTFRAGQRKRNGFRDGPPRHQPLNRHPTAHNRPGQFRSSDPDQNRKTCRSQNKAPPTGQPTAHAGLDA